MELIDGAFDLSRLQTDYPNLQVPNDRSRIHIGNLKATPLVVFGVLYVTTPLYQAAALDPITNFGRGGKVDLIAGIPRADRRPPINYSVSSAPIVLRDVVVVGSASSDQPRHKEAPPGYVRGFDDVRTGKLLWTFHTIPQPGELGYDTWEPDAWEYMGDANVWTLMSRQRCSTIRC